MGEYLIIYWSAPRGAQNNANLKKKFVETGKKFLTKLVRCAKLNRLTAERLRMFCTL